MAFCAWSDRPAASVSIGRSLRRKKNLEIRAKEIDNVGTRRNGLAKSGPMLLHLVGSKKGWRGKVKEGCLDSQIFSCFGYIGGSSCGGISCYWSKQQGWLNEER